MYILQRYGPIGVDNDGRSYWFFGIDRLYREAPFYRVEQQLPSSADRQYTYELVLCFYLCITITSFAVHA